MYKRQLQRVLQVYTTTHPNVKVSIHDRSTEEMRQEFEAGKLDLIISPEFTHPDLQWQTIYRLPQQLVMTPSHPLSSEQHIPIRDLAHHSLLIFSRYEYPQYWETLTTFCQTQGLHPKISGEFDGIESLKTALRAGLGIAILAGSNTLMRDSTFLHKACVPPLPELPVGIGYANYQAPETFIQHFINLCTI